MNDREMVALAIKEAAREKVDLPYRLIMIRQKEHEIAGRFAEATECAAIRVCLEKANEQ